MRSFEEQDARAATEPADRAERSPAPEEARGPLDVRTAAGLLRLQRTAGNAGVAQLMEGDEDRRAVEQATGAGGSPLDASTRVQMERSFGTDFGSVRVHTGSEADASARQLGAHAYTVGEDVVFAQGRFDASSAAGQRTLAHELTHVVQQRHGPVDGTPTGGGVRVSDPSDAFERAAESMADHVVAGRVADGPAGSSTAAPGLVQRLVDDEDEVQTLRDAPSATARASATKDSVVMRQRSLASAPVLSERIGARLREPAARSPRLFDRFRTPELSPEAATNALLDELAGCLDAYDRAVDRRIEGKDQAILQTQAGNIQYRLKVVIDIADRIAHGSEAKRSNAESLRAAAEHELDIVGEILLTQGINPVEGTWRALIARAGLEGGLRRASVTNDTGTFLRGNTDTTRLMTEAAEAAGGAWADDHVAAFRATLALPEAGTDDGFIAERVLELLNALGPPPQGLRTLMSDLYRVTMEAAPGDHAEELGRILLVNLVFLRLVCPRLVLAAGATPPELKVLREMSVAIQGAANRPDGGSEVGAAMIMVLKGLLMLARGRPRGDRRPRGT